MKNLIRGACFVFLSLLALSLKLAPKGNKVKKIMVDAGHGGKDPGALGKFSKEKDVALKIALELGKIIQDSMNDVTILYTRKTDEFIPIYQRAEEANKQNVDIFLSIHCNASMQAKSIASGLEVFAMGLEGSEKNLAVTKRENAAILMEDDRNEHYQGFNPESPESHILFSLYQNAYRVHSLKLAECIEKSLMAHTGRKSRGVKQAPFVVLWQAACPSVLVEVGFITNLEEEKFLNKKEGQIQIAQAIFEGVKDYSAVLEGQLGKAS
jgi:N-acetylmuramoyl-L-alanine amidase